MTWYDRQGQRTGTLDESAVYYSPQLSPDGKQLAVAVVDPATGNIDIWLYQLANNLKTRLIFGPWIDISPVWSPDGTQIAFASNRNGVFDLYRKSANNSGGDELLLQTSTNKIPTDWSPDGRYLLFEQRDPTQKVRSDIGVLPLFGEDRKPFLLPTGEAGAREAVIHPNGRWIAYTSGETGRDEVYVTSFPHPGSLRQISSAGGENPYWGRDGKELFYLSPRPPDDGGGSQWGRLDIRERCSPFPFLHSGCRSLGRVSVRCVARWEKVPRRLTPRSQYIVNHDCRQLDGRLEGE